MSEMTMGSLSAMGHLQSIQTALPLLPVDGVWMVWDKKGLLSTPSSGNDMLMLNVPIHVFITGDLAFYAMVVGKEGMDKAHC
jgi:hypothetical protein